jgi:hypothetical protein
MNPTVGFAIARTSFVVVGHVFVIAVLSTCFVGWITKKGIAQIYVMLLNACKYLNFNECVSDISDIVCVCLCVVDLL